MYYGDHLSFSLGSLHGYILVSWHPSDYGQISLYFRYLALTYTIYIFYLQTILNMETIRERISGYFTIHSMELYLMSVIFDQSEGDRQSKVVLNYCDPATSCITLCLKAPNLKLIIDNTREKITAVVS